MKKKIKKPGPGRPGKRSPELDEKIFFLAGKGFTDGELSFVLGIAESSLNNWKKDEAFIGALKKAKDKTDAEAEHSLFQRVIGGFEVKETQTIKDALGNIVSVRETTKTVPPDTLACIYWTKNRRPDRWREKHSIDLTKRDDSAGYERMPGEPEPPLNFLSEADRRFICIVLTKAYTRLRAGEKPPFVDLIRHDNPRTERFAEPPIEPTTEEMAATCQALDDEGFESAGRKLGGRREIIAEAAPDAGAEPAIDDREETPPKTPPPIRSFDGDPFSDW